MNCLEIIKIHNYEYTFDHNNLLFKQIIKGATDETESTLINLLKIMILITFSIAIIISFFYIPRLSKG